MSKGKGIARADRSRSQAVGKREQLTKTVKATGIPAHDHTERRRVLDRLKEKQR
mgnify:CR=1 FL=1